jgi:uncharacterized cupin superfamily protein
MRNLIRAIFVAVCVFAGGAWAAPTGYVHAVSGDVTITESGKAAAKAKLGDLFEQGTTFATGADGKVTLKFSDGQVVALAPNAQFSVVAYSYTTANAGSNNILFSLARGGMRFVTGLIGQTDKSKFAIRTPTLTAGIRGTDGEIIVAQDGSVLVSVLDGAVTMTSPAGTIVVTAGSYAFYPPGSNTPTANGPVSSLPAAALALIQIAAGLTATDLPPPSPVDVIEAAKAVIAAATQSAPAAPLGPQAPTPGGSGGGGGSKS